MATRTLTLNAVAMAQYIDDENYDIYSESYIVSNNGVYIEFDALPEALYNTMPKSGLLFFNAVGNEGPNARSYVWCFDERIDISNRIYPKQSYRAAGPEIKGMYNAGGGGTYAWYSASLSGQGAYLVGKFGAVIRTSYQSGNALYTSNYTFSIKSAAYNGPYLELTYDTGTQNTLALKPNGYVVRTNPNVFEWHTTYPGYPIEDIAQISATLQWKNGVNGAINSIPIGGASTSYTLPANTLPASDEIYWRVVAITSEGTTNPEWTKIRTTDVLPTTTSISPSGIYVDGTKTVRFVWEHAVDTGTTQTAYDLQINDANGEWTTIKTETTANQYADVAPLTLPSGTLLWRVRTYNATGTAGEWSNALTVVVIAAPAAPVSQVDAATPRPTVSWSSLDQQAYQVQIGNHDSGLQFGTAKVYKCPVFLPNGSTIARVRVLNEYNLWSEWAEVLFGITNVPDTAPTLSINAGCDAELAWGEVEDSVGYWIYRDGEHIATVDYTNYTDRLAIGNHTYFIRAVYADNDNYTDSNTVTATLSTDHPIICDLESDWISLRLSINSNPTIVETVTRKISLSQYAGAEYPVPEIAPYKSRTYNIAVAYLTSDTAQQHRFERLIGKLVCVKDQYNNLLVGVISAYTKTTTQFYTAYTATVSEVDKSSYGTLN